MGIALCITIAVMIIMMIIIVVGSHNKSEEIETLIQSKFNLINEINTLKNQIDMAIAKSENNIQMFNNTIREYRKKQIADEVKIRDLKSNVIELKQEKKKLLNQLKN